MDDQDKDHDRDHAAIGQLLTLYFTGLYRGDTALLRSVFHPAAALFAVQGGARYHKLLDDYLAGVALRESPQQLGESWRMRVLSVEVLQQMAVAKVHVPARGHNYFNYLTLLRLEGRWLIVSKVFDELPIQAYMEN